MGFSEHRTNQYPGKCRVCQEWVEGEAGTLGPRDEKTGKYTVRCSQHPIELDGERESMKTDIPF